ncbi:AGAP000181-PA-like protein [Anopheles sinensis]|uniref:Riboflavin transporter n=1 Tax=Anopheles sinensis TaxID=74873 RepID=A0A084VIX0_ANOSI|nr:AGAP000181-PA-like protein [Anopheles sinensis]
MNVTFYRRELVPRGPNHLSGKRNRDKTVHYQWGRTPASMKNPMRFISRGIGKDRRLTVDLLAILFGIGAWLGINSTYVQLPLLVGSAPESWNLPSYLVVVIQLGNIGPILYTAVQRLKSFRDAYLIVGLLLVGAGSAMATAFVYDQTVTVFGAERSVPLFVTVFGLALVGCTSSVLFMPYMGRFRDIYLITYLIGEGLGGFVPSIVALSQGVGGNGECILVSNGTDSPPQYTNYTPPPRFGTRTYFIIASAILAISLISFLLLDRLKVCRKEYAAITIANGNSYTYQTKTPGKAGDSGETETPAQEDTVARISRRNYLSLMVLIGVLCLFGNGFFPSIQSYSCLPYGNVAYHLTVTLSSMANPAACFLAFFVHRNSVRSIVLLSLLTVPFAVYAITTAILSPDPPLMHHTMGDILLISCWTILMGLISYIRLAITTLLRVEGGQTLVWVGVSTQLGSLIGSLLSFALVNFTDTFEQYYPC